MKERLEPQTWQVFWRIAVDGCSIREAADEAGNVVRGRVCGAEAGRDGCSAPKARFVSARLIPGVLKPSRLKCPDARTFTSCPLALPTRLSPGLATTRSTAVEWIAVEAHVQHCEKCMGLMEKLLAHDTATESAPASALLPAKENLPQIAGFDIQGELGRGGMGVVYRAWEAKAGAHGGPEDRAQRPDDRRTRAQALAL